MMNKKGDIQSMIFTIAAVFTIGLTIFFMSHFFGTFYSEFQTVLNDTASIDETKEASEALAAIQAAEQSVWDYAFLGILMGYIILIGIFTFTTRINPVFFWIGIIITLLGLFMGVVLSNTWQAIAVQPDLQETVARFPIMDAILGTYYPTIIVFVFLIGMILLFGKPVQSADLR